MSCGSPEVVVVVVCSDTTSPFTTFFDTTVVVVVVFLIPVTFVGDFLVTVVVDVEIGDFFTADNGFLAPIALNDGDPFTALDGDFN